MLAADIFSNGAELQVMTDLDQTLLRLSNTAGASVFEPVLYELPQTGTPVNAPLDATKLEPGEPITEQPAPVQESVNYATEQPAEENKVVEWVKKNPLAAAGIVVGAYLLLKNRKK